MLDAPACFPRRLCSHLPDTFNIPGKGVPGCEFLFPSIFAGVTSLTRLNTGALPISERCKVLVCDSDIGDASWVSRKHVAFYPFKGQASSDANFTEIFSKREGDGNTQEFQDALSYAHMFYDTSKQEEALKLLQMGRVGRQKLLLLHNNLVAHKKFCEDVKEQKIASRKGKKRNCNHQIEKKTTKKKAPIQQKTIKSKASTEKKTLTSCSVSR